ncbi:hypothetical protein ACFFRR_003402 [Megaselia abdita]
MFKIFGINLRVFNLIFGFLTFCALTGNVFVNGSCIFPKDDFNVVKMGWGNELNYHEGESGNDHRIKREDVMDTAPNYHYLLSNNLFDLGTAFIGVQEIKNERAKKQKSQ